MRSASRKTSRVAPGCGCTRRSSGTPSEPRRRRRWIGPWARPPAAPPSARSPTASRPSSASHETEPPPPCRSPRPRRLRSDPLIRQPRSRTVTPGYDQPLYILAFDHRTSFTTKLFGIQGTPTPAERERVQEAKQIILAGLVAAAESAPAGTVGGLVDEEHGAAVARAAKQRGIPFAMSA